MEVIICSDGEWVRKKDEKPTRFNMEEALDFLKNGKFEVITLYKTYTCLNEHSRNNGCVGCLHGEDCPMKLEEEVE
jgi:hypothetical protein